MRSALKITLKVFVCATFVAVMVWTRPPAPSDAGISGKGEATPGVHSQFRAAYQDAIRRVGSTGDPIDDLRLAEKMFSHASSESTAPGLVTILCDNAYTLATRSGQGDVLAVKAMELLALRVPGKADIATSQIIQLYEKRFNITRHVVSRVYRMDDKPDLKETLGRRLLDALLELVDVRVARRDYKSAKQYLAKAQRVADQLRWPELMDGIDQRQAVIRDRRKAQTRLALFIKRLDANPWETKSLTEVIRLQVVEFDDTKAASDFLRRGGAKQADELVPLMLKMPKSPVLLGSDDTLRLAKWLVAMADANETTVTGQVQTLVRVKSFYEAYLALNSKKDEQAPNGKDSSTSKSKVKAVTAKDEPGAVTAKLTPTEDQLIEMAQAKIAIREIDQRIERLKKPLRVRLLARGRTVNVYWASGGAVDLYHNGRPLKPYLPDYRTRKTGKQAINQVRMILKRSDVFTAGLRMSGAAHGFMMAAIDSSGQVLWHSGLQHWKGYTTPDQRHWYLPNLAIRSKQFDVTLQTRLNKQQQELVKRFGNQLSVVLVPGDVTPYLFSVVRSLGGAAADAADDTDGIPGAKPSSAIFGNPRDRSTKDVFENLRIVPTSSNVKTLPVLGD